MISSRVLKKTHLTIGFCTATKTLVGCYGAWPIPWAMRRPWTTCLNKVSLLWKSPGDDPGPCLRIMNLFLPCEPLLIQIDGQSINGVATIGRPYALCQRLWFFLINFGGKPVAFSGLSASVRLPWVGLPTVIEANTTQPLGVYTAWRGACYGCPRFLAVEASMDEFLVGETLRLLRWRAELLKIINGPNADRRIKRWLLAHRAEMMAMVERADRRPSATD